MGVWNLPRRPQCTSGKSVRGFWKEDICSVQCDTQKENDVFSTQFYFKFHLYKHINLKHGENNRETMNTAILEVGSRVFFPHFCLFLLPSDSIWIEHGKGGKDSMGHKSGIDELVQEVNVSLAMDPMAVGETDLCFPQCIATETAPNLCALSLGDPSLPPGATGEPPRPLRIGWRYTKYAENSYYWAGRFPYSLLDLPIFLLLFTEFPMQYTSTDCILDVNELWIIP